MDFNPEEQEIRKVLESHRLRRPPASLMRNYEEEVMKKIHSPAGPSWGWAVSFAGVAALIFLLAFVFLIRTQPAKNSAQISSPVTDAMKVQVFPEQEGILFEKMASDLLILEMLGEDEGLFDSFERLETDMEFLGQVNKPL